MTESKNFSRKIIMQNPWSNYANIWNGHTEPLEPTEPDIQSYKMALDFEESDQKNLCAILGVTRKLHDLCSNIFTRVTANDFNPAMIEKVWPGNPKDAYLCNWKHLPYEDGKLDAAVCDGGWHLLDTTTKLDVAKELHRTLRKNGRFAIRLFLPIEPTPTLDDIRTAFDTGLVHSVNYLKVLLWFATAAEHGNLTAPLKDVWKNFFKWPKDQDPYQLLTSKGFTQTSISTLDIYKDNEACYIFETLENVKKTFLSEGFHLLSESRPNYHFGDFFPVLCFKK
jgi:SAM-dependent methyltransferase